MFNLYENISALCNERGISVSKMCFDCGMSRSTLSNLKNGRSETITPATARKFAEYLNVTVDEVMRGKKENPSQEKDELIDALQSVRDVDRILYEVTKDMTIAEVELLTEFARSLKNANRGY